MSGKLGRQIRKGKVKEVYETEKRDELEFVFTDQISVFDKIIPTLIDRKGETLCRTSAHWFDQVKDLGFATHFLSLPAPNRMRVRRIDIKQPEELTKDSRNVLVPLEVICRHYVAGSLHDRISKGEIDPKTLGFPAGKKIDYGAKISKPMLEVTTKLEKVDRPLTYEEAMDMAKLTEDEFRTMLDMVLKIDEVIGKMAEKRGLIHVDGKKEFALNAERKFMLIDTFGTADEDRFWDAAEYKKGNLLELSKETVRQHYRASGYYDTLMAARKAKRPEPDIPALPGEFAAQVSKLYIDLFERLTGKRF